MKVEVLHYTAFPKGKNGGNKAGVVLEADHLSDSEMQAIAHKVGYSETAFVMESNKADFKVRYFSPTSEVDLCGHATIATFNALRDVKKVKKKTVVTAETNVGILDIIIEKNEVYMEQLRPIFLQEVKPFEVLDCFYEEKFINPDLPIIVASTGLKEIFVPVKDVETLHKLHPKMHNIRYLCQEYDTIGIHLFALDDKVDAYGRNFAPMVGIDEESATGTSNGALACLLSRFYKPSQTEFTLRQGYSMGMPSEISVKLEKHKQDILKVLVGGSAKTVK
jgi:PhzF family phenazine biosynthesis protein